MQCLYCDSKQEEPDNDHSWGRRARRCFWQVDLRTREVSGVRTCAPQPQTDQMTFSGVRQPRGGLQLSQEFTHTIR
jgi:hypothetical protein